MKKMLLLFLLVLAGCAHNPIVDMQGVNRRQYRQDLTECRQYAEQVNVAGETATHGAAGAAVGAALGAIVGDHRTAQKIGGVGAVTGATRGAKKARHRKERVMRNCLRGRGYKVLG
jgi:outer membrane lipoprotein SlyB